EPTVQLALSSLPADGARFKSKLLDNMSFLVACLILVVLITLYGVLGDNVLSLEELNLDTAAAMTLILAATGQTIVLLRGGIDLSIGGMISLGTVVAATQLGNSWVTIASWSGAIVVIGLAVGITNGLIISL